MCAFKRSLVTGQNIGSLLKKIAYGGLPRGKKILRIRTASGIEKNIYSTFDGRKSIADARFFPPKDLVYISINTRLDSRPQTFFSFGQPSIHKKGRKFPTKSLSFFQLSPKRKLKRKLKSTSLFFPLIDL